MWIWIAGVSVIVVVPFFTFAWKTKQRFTTLPSGVRAGCDSMARQLDGGGQAGRNWVLLLAIVFCLEFWVFVTSESAENL